MSPPLPYGNQDWEHVDQEFPIRAYLEHLKRVQYQQRLALQNMDRELQGQRSEFGESFARFQVDVRAALNTRQGEIRNEMQNLHNTLSDEIRTQCMTLELPLKRLLKQHEEQEARVHRSEEACSEEYRNLRERNRRHLQEVKAVGERFAKWKKAREGASANATITKTRTSTPSPSECAGDPNCGPQPPRLEPANGFSETQPSGGKREDCPYCHQSYTKQYVKFHIKKKVCRKGKQGRRSS